MEAATAYHMLLVIAAQSRRTYVHGRTAPQNGLFYDSNPMGFRSDFPSAIRELSDFDVLSASRTPLGHPSYHARIPSFFPLGIRSYLIFPSGPRILTILAPLGFPLGPPRKFSIRSDPRGSERRSDLFISRGRSNEIPSFIALYDNQLT